MLSRPDLNRVTAFKSSVSKLNKSLYSASESEAIKYFEFQENLVKGITDFKVRKKLLTEIKTLKESGLKNHKEYT